MENEQLSAYHESARVVITYINGYAADLVELPANAAGGTKLNAGHDLPLVQGIFSGKANAFAPSEMHLAIQAARKLMAIYCAGSCARIYLENNLSVPQELELSVEGQDMVMLQKIQTFLNNNQVEDADDFATEAIVSVFKQLQQPDVWKAITLLANKLMKADASLNRFYIEDTLMMAGIKVAKPSSKAGYKIGVHEEDEPIAVQEAGGAKNFSPLDLQVRHLLQSLKSDWSEEALTEATGQLHNIYKKYA